MITMTDLLSFWISPLRPLYCLLLDGQMAVLLTPPTDWQKANGLEHIAFMVPGEKKPRLIRPAHLAWQNCGTKLRQTYED